MNQHWIAMGNTVPERGETAASEDRPSSPQAPPKPASKRPCAEVPRGAPAKVLAISGAPAAVRVALARHGTHEDSTRAPLPLDYPYPTRMRMREYEMWRPIAQRAGAGSL